MAIYFERSSGVGNSAAASVDDAPQADAEPMAAAGRKPRRLGVPKKLARAAPSAHPEDAIPAGQCPRCGCIADHATPKDCIDQLRDELAEATGAELRAR